MTESETSVEVDTFQVSNIEPYSINTYSGSREFFSAGIFDDPLFGNLEATALLNPDLATYGEEIEAGTEMTLRLQVNADSTYGDTLSQTDYELIPISEIWRGKAWQLQDEVDEVLPPEEDQDPIATFSLSDEDSIDVDLEQEWVDEYLNYYNNESADREDDFIGEFFGFAIVPQNESKIVPFSRSDTQFILDAPGDERNISVGQSAYSLDRTDEQSENDAENLYNTLENITGFDMDISRDAFGTTNISRAELKFYPNTERLEESIEQASEDAVRPDSLDLELHYLPPEDLSDRLDPGTPIARAEYDEDADSYTFELTDFVNSMILDGLDEENRFFVTLRTNDGVIRSSLLFNNNATEQQQPKIIITSIKSDR